jgi:hypothetical protein
LHLVRNTREKEERDFHEEFAIDGNFCNGAEW